MKTVKFIELRDQSNEPFYARLDAIESFCGSPCGDERQITKVRVDGQWMESKFDLVMFKMRLEEAGGEII